ncbi:MAG: DUF1801 domain-containing protein [Bacteroidetes bacterium]|nr:DUF1801 domain-containing protein [Bacteroidota bacterium]
MEKSANKEVQKFIDEIKMLDTAKFQVLEELRKITFENYPEVQERMMYGGIMFSLYEDISGVFVYKNHISMEFSHGFKFDDPENALEGKGKHRRHIKFKSFDDIETKKVDFFVKQIKAFES